MPFYLDILAAPIRGPINDWRYSTNANRMLFGNPREVLHRRISLLREQIPRMNIYHPRRPLLAYSDSAGSGHLGCIVYVDGARTAIHTALVR